MSPLDVLTRIEPNRIVLKVLFISTGKTSDRSKAALCSCLHVWRQFRQTSTNTNSFKTWGLKGTLNKIQRRYYLSSNRQNFTLMYPGLNSLGSNLGQAFESESIMHTTPNNCMFFFILKQISCEIVVQT